MDYKNVQPLADFDWSAIDKKEQVNNEESQKVVEAYEKTFNMILKLYVLVSYLIM